MPKSWSIEEMHRRWQVTRQRMKESQLDCLLVSQHHSGEMIAERMDGDADVEWLTGNSLPFKFVVFPLEGAITAFSTGQVRRTPEEKMAADRGIDLRIAKGAGLWSDAIIDCLREKNMAQARFGVTDLANAPRQPEGEISYTTYDRILKAFPQAKFESVGDLLWRLKLVHSQEEIAVLERANLVSEIGIEAMMESCAAGSDSASRMAGHVQRHAERFRRAALAPKHPHRSRGQLGPEPPARGSDACRPNSDPGMLRMCPWIRIASEPVRTARSGHRRLDVDEPILS